MGFSIHQYLKLLIFNPFIQTILRRFERVWLLGGEMVGFCVVNVFKRLLNAFKGGIGWH